MGRSGYDDDMSGNWSFICYRGAVKSAINGARGQMFLREMLTALDALPYKALIANDLEGHAKQSVSHWGIVDVPAVCAIGAVGKKRFIDMTMIDAYDTEAVATTFGIADAMAREIMFENDEGGRRETPEQRFHRVRQWVVDHLRDGRETEQAMQHGKTEA